MTLTLLFLTMAGVYLIDLGDIVQNVILKWYMVYICFVIYSHTGHISKLEENIRALYRKNWRRD